MIPGIEARRVEEWLASHLDGLHAPLRFSLITGGHSNLTARVIDDRGHVVVLRRPPIGEESGNAHDMRREWRVLAALSDTPVPVPRPLAFCADRAVTGSDFYVMEHAAGHVLHDSDAVTSASSPTQRARCGGSLVDALLALHAVNPDDVGLGDLGPRDGYVARQIRRWRRSYEEAGIGDIRLMDEIASGLLERVPRQQAVGIVHGDYRLGNCCLDDDGSVTAILDWELCTLGDPLADLGYLIATWAEVGDEHLAVCSSPTFLPGFVDRAGIERHYRQRAPFDLETLGFYIAFNLWKVACITQNVFARYLRQGDAAPAGLERESARASIDEHARRSALELDAFTRAW